MQLRKNHRPEIDKVDPWKSDNLQRKKVAEYLTPIIASVTQPFVISLSAPYGTGKSMFLECWRVDLENQGYKVVLFNAWETDFSQDALLAFVSAIRKQLEPTNKSKSSALVRDKFTKVTKAVGGFMRQDLLPLVAKAITRKFIGDEDTQKLMQKLELKPDEVDTLLGDLAKESLRSQEAAEESLENFKEYLKDAVAEVVKNSDVDEKKKVLIFVDELDRCRPTYAIQVLECIKHLFSVDGLLFVLAMDDKQIASSVKAIYGSAFDTDGYLRRFIDWNFHLPSPSYEVFSNYLINRFSLNETEYAETLSNEFPAYAKGLSLSLREQEQCFSELNLILRSYHGQRYLLSEQLIAFSVIKVRHKDLLRDACVKRASYTALLNVIRQPLSQARFSYNSWEKIEPYFISWFLNMDEARSLNHLAKEANDKYNSISGGPEKDRALKEWEIPRNIVSAFDEMRRFVRLPSDKTVAEYVWGEFEKFLNP